MPTSPLILTDPNDDTSATGPWLPILKKYGLATVMALAFAWFLMSVVHGQLKSNGDKTDAVKSALDQHSQDMHVDQAATRAIQEQQLRTLVALCRNSATSTREQNLCGAVK